jgi:type IV pilus assembly protein PilC
MATYVFKVADLAGVKSSGEVEAESKGALEAQLKSRGLIVLDVADKRSSQELNLAFMQRVKANDLAAFARQLATLITSGVSILRSLYVLEDQTEDKFLKDTIVAVRKDVEGGTSLGDAMERHPKVFGQLFVAMVRAGEAGGVLESSLQRVADQVEKDAALKRLVRSAMVYPAMVTTIAIGVMLALVTFIVPVFKNVLTEFGGKLPLPTQVCVAMSNAITKSWFGVVPGIVGIFITFGIIVFAFLRWKRTEMGHRQWDRLKLRVPMKIGTIVQEVAVARWSRTLASLTAAGVPLMLSIEITGKTGGNVAVEEAMDDVTASVKRGGTLAAPLARASVFPAMVTHMVGVGEETGALDVMLEKVAEFYEDRVEASIKALTSILEPVMIMVIGGMVGFVVISMYLPLFELYNHVQ